MLAADLLGMHARPAIAFSSSEFKALWRIDALRNATRGDECWFGCAPAAANQARFVSAVESLQIEVDAEGAHVAEDFLREELQVLSSTHGMRV